MSIDQTDVVDWLGVEESTGAVLLTLIDDMDWADERLHLLLLQEKLNRYLAFVESGEALDELAARTGKRVPAGTLTKISVLLRHPPSEEGARFFEHVEGIVKEAGIGFSFKVL